MRYKMMVWDASVNAEGEIDPKLGSVLKVIPPGGPEDVHVLTQEETALVLGGFHLLVVGVYQRRAARN